MVARSEGTVKAPQLAKAALMGYVGDLDVRHRQQLGRFVQTKGGQIPDIRHARELFDLVGKIEF